jgi:uncharacterized protein with HEPN domain
MPTPRDELYLTIIAEAIGDIQRRLSACDLQKFLGDRDEQALLAFRLSIIGENANKLSDALKTRHAHLPWADMYVFRNIVSHEYHCIDAVLTWEAATQLYSIAAMATAELAQIGAVRQQKD